MIFIPPILTICMERYWAYNVRCNNYIPSQNEPLSAFPTIIDTKRKKVWCRSCHRWENIIAFSQNVLKTGCGKLYAGPFTRDDSIFCYGYDISRRDKNYTIKVQSQMVATNYRRLLETIYDLDLKNKVLYKDGKAIYLREDITEDLCQEITKRIIDEIGDDYKKQFGIKPSVTSSLNGFSALLGYMLCPFNVNFFTISRHWGLNPKDADFTSMSSGDTPDAENEMFASLGIRPTKSIRKLYQKFPQGIISYAAVKDLGITDVNLLMKSTTAKWYAFFQFYMLTISEGEIYYLVRTALRQFVHDMLALTNQKTVWNSLDRTINYLADKTIQDFFITDGIQLYIGCSPHLTEREKRQILSEGFNRYTHDFLMRRSNALADEIAIERRRRVDAAEIQNAAEHNEHFILEQQFLNLEYKAGESFKTNSKKERVPVPDEERYCFYVAKDSLTLKIIGSEMRNCVGWGYAEAVRERRATIVYAMHKGKYRICIEVTPDFTIRQAFGPCNNELDGEAFEAYSEWCQEKHIVRRKAFSIHCAPRG